jgi:hypothetical protein
VHPSFDSLREQLLRAGIAPRRVRRYVAELREHMDDLVARERASGLDAGAAYERALALLGDESQLACAMINRANRSLAARAPRTVFVLSPVLLQAALIFAIAFSMMHMLSPVREMTLAEMPKSYRLLIGIVGGIANHLIWVLVSVGCILIAVRQRIASGWVWVGLGLIAVAGAFFGFHMHIIPPAGGYHGRVIFTLADLTYANGRLDLGASIATATLRACLQFAAAAAAYGILRVRLIATGAIGR